MSTTSNGGARARTNRRAAKNAPPACADQRTVALARIHVEEGFNPRQRFDEAGLEQLAQSIRLRGLLQPLVVSPDGGDDFRLIAGERRYRAAMLAELTEVPVIVRAVREDTRGLDDALVENMTRQDLDPLEQARGFQQLVDSGLTRTGVAELLGVSQKLVGDRLQILSLPEELHAQIADGTIPPSAVKPLAELAKAHAGLPTVAVRCITDSPLDAYEQPSWADLVEDPVEVLLAVAPDEDLPPDVFRSGGSYPLTQFALTEAAAKDLEKLLKLTGGAAEDIQLRLGRESLEQALALKSALMGKDGHFRGALLLGQDVADQLASDRVSALLKEERARQRREREWERDRKAAAAEGGGNDLPGDQPTQVEDPAEQRRREAAERAERKREATAYNAELGATVYSKLSRLKVDERVLKVVAAVGFHTDLGNLAARGARYGFPGWPVETTTKGGKPKVEYLGTGDSADKARDYLAGAKTAGDVAGRLFALVVMAVYVRQEAVAQSAQAYYDVRFHGDSLPWSKQVVSLVEEIAEERLPQHLTEARRLERKQREREELEREQARRAKEKAQAELEKRLPALDAEERSAALTEFTGQHGWEWKLDQLVSKLNEAEQAPPEEVSAAADRDDAEGAEVVDPTVDDAELDYSDGASEEEAELVAA